MTKSAWVFGLVLILFLCSMSCVAVVAQSNRCVSYQLPIQVGMITHPLLDQVSGMVASRLNQNVWWVINNSGHPTNIYAITGTGQLLATFEVAGTENWDWEDLSIGPNADGSGPALYIGDIGDDDLIRNGQVVVYRINEPSFNPLLAFLIPIRDRITRVESFPARYPDGRQRNAEALFVDQGTGQIYIVTNEETSVVYRYPMPLRADQLVTLERIAEVEPTMANGAGVTSDGLRVVIRNDHEAYEYYRNPGEPLEAMFADDKEPVQFRLAHEAQGEAIGYTYDNQAVVTTSKILPSPLSKVNCSTWE